MLRLPAVSKITSGTLGYTQGALVAGSFTGHGVFGFNNTVAVPATALYEDTASI